MRRSASLQGISTSAIRSQPLLAQTPPQPPSSRLAERRHSARQLPRPSLTQEPAEIVLLRNQNASLRAENQRLREELVKLAAKTSGVTTNTDKKVSAYRQIIKNKFTSRTKASRITTECQTAVLSSKETSLDYSRLALEELYENCLHKKLPALEELSAVAERFFADYCDNYAKLKVLLSCLERERARSEYKRLTELLQLYRLPLLYQKTPQVLFRQLTKSKEKSKKESTEECLEVLSPQETVSRLEGLLQKLCRSSQMLRLLRNNQHVLKFITKIQNSKH